MTEAENCQQRILKWKRRFQDVLSLHREEYADFSGALPAHRLSLTSLCPDQREAPLRAVAEIINELKENPEEFWLKGIVSIVRDLTWNGDSTPILRKSCYDKLFFVSDGARPYILRCLIFSGHKLTPSELDDERLAFVKATKPIDWLDAVLLMGGFERVAQEVSRWLADGKGLYPPLDGWYQQWPNSHEFIHVVKRWEKACRNKESKEYIRTWLKLNVAEENETGNAVSKEKYEKASSAVEPENNFEKKAA